MKNRKGMKCKRCAGLLFHYTTKKHKKYWKDKLKCIICGRIYTILPVLIKGAKWN